MKQQDLRTYKRRGVTRESGYHTCEETTGSECKIVHSQKLIMREESKSFTFHRGSIELIELFSTGNGFIAFGGYIYTDKPIRIRFSLSYSIHGDCIKFEKEFTNPINVNDWNNIGFHKEVSLDYGTLLTDVTLVMTIEGDSNANLEFISFDFDAITKDEFIGEQLCQSFKQKTSMHIPYLYYLETEKPFEEYLIGDETFTSGRVVVLKSCNRCGRYLPINIDNEMSTLSFSLHCKKRAPCVHATFRAYTIHNTDEISDSSSNRLKLDGKKVVSYYGHQLECKACKKFFVNAPLNPQRNAQQFKEDGLRRRAIEDLVNHLLGLNLIHFEFKRLTKKEFSEHIWRKFNCRCFKCNKKLTIDEMNLDHTMPLAYLYRLDETATCLCGIHNSQKSDHFPIDYYTKEELEKLSKITGLPMERIIYKGINQTVLNLLVDNVVWFYDEFLMKPDYQKVRDMILTADKINDSLKRVINGNADLAEEYHRRKGRYPTSITIG